MIWSGLLAALAWMPWKAIRAFRRWRLGRRGVVVVDLGKTRSRGAWGRADVQVALLRAMATDEALRAVVVNVRNLHMGWATLQDVRAALLGLRDAGKLVVMHLDEVGNRELYIASTADRVWVAPCTEVLIGGVGARLVFYGDVLSRVGARVEIVAAGEFKSFGEPYTRSGPSPANREQVQALVDDLFEQFCADVAASRGVDPAVVEELAARCPAPAQALVDAGLAHGVVYADQARKELEKLLDASVRGVPFARYAWWAWLEEWLGSVGQKRAVVAVVHLQGPVVHGAEPVGGAGYRIDADRVLPVLERLREDDNVRAVVLEVDSPGGSAVASDLIARAVRRVAEHKPVVASFGDVSASGGYYLAAPAQEIVARPGSITGSIGVVAGKVAFGPALGRLGVHAEQVRSGPDSGLFSGWEAMAPHQRQRLREMVERTYARFVATVAAGRRVPATAVEEAARGRVWSGRQALERGLVDHLGDLEVALARARGLSGRQGSPRQEIHIHFPPPRLRVLSSLLRRDEVSLDAVQLAAHLLGPRAAQALWFLRAHPGEALALLPWDLS